MNQSRRREQYRIVTAVVFCAWAIGAGAAPGAWGQASSPGVSLLPRDGAVEVLINGELFTRYVYEGAPKPYCYPIIGPTGKAVTRAFPMEMVEGESRDHPHQRSLWFTFGNVNGIDFWSEGPEAGRIVQRRLVLSPSPAASAAIITENDWLAPEGTRVCRDIRHLRFSHDADGRVLDFIITIRASDGPVTFGDTKEGMFGIRVADSIRVDRGQGHIVNARGDRDGQAWGKAAEWCDYYGPIEGEVVGIAVFDHPANLRHPTYWHVRDYGLFAANPFGLSHFVGQGHDGTFTLAAGQGLVFRYRVYLHRGDSERAQVARKYQEWLGPPLPPARYG